MSTLVQSLSVSFVIMFRRNNFSVKSNGKPIMNDLFLLERMQSAFQLILLQFFKDMNDYSVPYNNFTTYFHVQLVTKFNDFTMH